SMRAGTVRRAAVVVLLLLVSGCSAVTGADGVVTSGAPGPIPTSPVSGGLPAASSSSGPVSSMSSASNMTSNMASRPTSTTASTVGGGEDSGAGDCPGVRCVSIAV